MLENVEEPFQEYCVPLERFWTADQLDLRSEAFCRDMLVMVETDARHFIQEFVGRNKTTKVHKAVLCYPDSSKPKNGYLDVV